jgi:hypothetical protein
VLKQPQIMQADREGVFIIEIPPQREGDRSLILHLRFEAAPLAVPSEACTKEAVPADNAERIAELEMAVRPARPRFDNTITPENFSWILGTISAAVCLRLATFDLAFLN